MYSSKEEFIECYIDNKLNEYNTKLTDDYIKHNFYDVNFSDECIDVKYSDGCFCYLDEIDDCECGDDIHYYDDEFMRNKIPMFPKNIFFQKYYENIFPKRFFLNKIFYYLPYDCKRIRITYIDKNIIDTYDISRTITYYFINNSIALINDQMDGWFGKIFNHYHTPTSENINNYIEILNTHNINSNDVTIIKY
jgi:hypothetical protein